MSMYHPVHSQGLFRQVVRAVQRFDQPQIVAPRSFVRETGTANQLALVFTQPNIKLMERR